ncbi:OsmC/Ohr family protein [Arcticibacter svalbardensis MN12-7]|uniref:OsmC/Ohr family protein n=1 Tax=Arcticibacter svalbardensis MN12-7 TaxID=1150600 RepID=R9GV73_9SPHI|nr:OsmC family protein [Arcticibacter svalbardensis]EOR95578.1 OsmC/Ohr family protein [Arcticibacter svalbardensis MN12-7]
MKIEINRVNDAVHFEASAPSSTVKVHIDGSPEIGGQGLGVRPMELVLMALGSCSSLDLISILKKQRQDIQDISISVEADRTDAVPAVFTAIRMTFNLKGNIDPAKAEKAAELAVKKYCSVHDMLAAGGVKISYTINIE